MTNVPDMDPRLISAPLRAVPRSSYRIGMDQACYTDVRTGTLVRAVPYVVLATMSVCMLMNILPILGFDAWRHDDLPNIADGYFPWAAGDSTRTPAFSTPYLQNVRTEGRWLTWLLSGILLRLPESVWWLTGYLGFVTFCYVLALQAKDRLYVPVLTLLFLQTPAYISQSFWPATTAPALILLGALSLASRRAPFWLLFPPAAVVLFATIPPFYFLLPLLYLDRIGSSGKLLASPIVLLATWAASFVLGYLVADTWNLVAFGRFGIEIAAWRQPHYIHSLSDVHANLRSSGVGLRREAGRLLGSAFIWAPLLAAFALRFTAKPDPRDVLSLLTVGVSCMLAQFAVTLPTGLSVATRSLIALSVGATAIGFLQAPGTPGRRAVLCALALPPFLASWSLSNDMVRYVGTVAHTYRDELVRAVPRPPETYKGLLLWDGDVGPFEAAVVEGFGLKRADGTLANNLFWMPAARAAGFRRVVLCGQAQSFCDARRPSKGLADCVGEPGFYCVRGVSDDGYLIISLVDPLRPG